MDKVIRSTMRYRARPSVTTAAASPWCRSIVEPLPPTHVTVLRLKRHTPRPAVQSFAD